MELISIIVPIYNVEKYLKQCLESIVNQTYKNLEIILIDDGSPDNCGIICDEYAEKDNRIKVVHKENGGVSSARNIGLKMVTGRYISFIDPDDYVDNNFIMRLYNLIKEYNTEIAECNFVKFEKKPENISEKIKIIKYSSYEMQKRIYSNCYINTVVLWNKLFKTCLYKNIVFPEGKINEDEAIIHEVFSNAQNVITTNEILYYYRYNPSSIMGKTFNLSRFDILDALEARKKFYKCRGQEELYALTVIEYQKKAKEYYVRVRQSEKLRKKYKKKAIKLVKENYKEYKQLKNISLIDKFKTSFFVFLPNTYFVMLKIKDCLFKKE